MPSRHFPQNLSPDQADIWNTPRFPAIRPKMDPAIIDEVLDSMPECLCSMQEFGLSSEFGGYQKQHHHCDQAVVPCDGVWRDQP